MREAWEIYSESFADNFIEFKTKFEKILDNEIDKIELSEFTQIIDMLEKFGENVSDYITKYVDTNSEKLSRKNHDNLLYTGRLKNKELIQKIATIPKQNRNLNIDNVSMFIANNRGWNSEHIDFLSTLSKDNYRDWMKSSPDDLSTKVRSGLLLFRDMSAAANESDTAKFKSIAENVIGALKEIASENQFNQERVKSIYDIE
ncbi:MAG: hypothetical protein MI863_18245 [Desulfobacterales bacterium]|nr:hypothetical protein [Desulfobacterales bacterium]